MPPFHLTVPPETMKDFCRRWKIARLELFGSALREDFRPDSDVDLLVSFTPEARWDLLDRVAMQDELSELFRRKVDLVSRKGIEASENPIRREAILSSARPFYF